MTAPLNTAKLGFLLPVVLNPATAAVVGIGLGLLWLLRDDDEEGEVTVEVAPINQTKPTVGTVAEPSPAVGAQPDVEGPEEDEAAPAAISQANQKEMIRNAMSELGKRSAAARAKKRAERQKEVGL